MRKILVLVLTVCCGYPLFGQQQTDQVLQYNMKTRWSDEVDPKNVWSGYPRPQMVREDWENLNGYWEYAISTKGESQPTAFEGKILVPFPVESTLSEVKKLVGEDHELWYKKVIKAPKLNAHEKLLLHFGAVDWESTVYVNGKEVGKHQGGYDPFTYDITKYLKKGEQELVVRVWDPSDKGMQARGKQVSNPEGIWYTPVTGIWQTVWIEKVPENYVQHVKITPDIDQRNAVIDLQFPALTQGTTVVVKATADGKEIALEEMPVGAKSEKASVTLQMKNPTLWSPDNPFLYDLQISLKGENGEVIDEVQSYFGMRKIALGKDPNGYTRILLNNEPLFQFGLLDQGWWPDGLYTAPNEEAMVYDIQVTKDLGFNMLRKHVKVEPARFYYHCDKMGMLVWQDMPSGFQKAENEVQHVKHDAEVDWKRPLASAIQFEKELKAMMDHLYSYPSIVVWVPLNEGWGQYDTKRLADWVKAYDPSRLVDAPSGWADRGAGDMIDVHLYPGPGMELPEQGRASVLGEFGGLGWPVKDHLWWDKRNWGYLTYQDQATYRNEFKKIIQNLEGLIGWGLSGAIYTQTTDVEGEVNGLMTYDREVLKLDAKETKQWLASLYQHRWHQYSLLQDAEHRPQTWKVSFEKPEGDWQKSSYDDFAWASKTAPFSNGENPFLPPSTEWTESNLFARRTFYLEAIPTSVFLKYYAPKTKVKLYINGHMVQELQDGGGRKRHYTHILLNDVSQYLKTGKNVIAIEATQTDENSAIDLGLYATEPIKEGKTQLQKADNETEIK